MSKHMVVGGLLAALGVGLFPDQALANATDWSARLSTIEAAGAHTSLEGVRYGGGLEYSVTPNTYISAEYQRTEYEDNFGGRDAGVVGIGFRF